jgi:hypothetical protein
MRVPRRAPALIVNAPTTLVPTSMAPLLAPLLAVSTVADLHERAGNQAAEA